MNNYIVYKHTSPSGKVYIGITAQNVTKRWKNGKGYEGCTAFYRAIEKYGWQNIRHEILFTGLSKEDACLKEQLLIAEHDSTNPEHGYNLTSGGEHYEPNAEWREKLSKANKEYYRTHPEAKERMTRHCRGKHYTDEEKAYLSQKLKQFFIDHPEQRYERGKSFRGKKRGEEFSRKLGERKSKPIICLDTGVIYKSLTFAASELGIDRNGITNMLRGKAKTCGGYKFAYVNKEE